MQWCSLRANPAASSQGRPSGWMVDSSANRRGRIRDWGLGTGQETEAESTFTGSIGRDADSQFSPVALVGNEFTLDGEVKPQHWFVQGKGRQLPFEFIEAGGGVLRGPDKLIPN